MERYIDYHVELFDKLMNSGSEGCVMLSCPCNAALSDLLRLVAVENTRRCEDERITEICKNAGIASEIEVRLVPRMGICIDDDSHVGPYRDDVSFEELLKSARSVAVNPKEHEDQNDL